MMRNVIYILMCTLVFLLSACSSKKAGEDRDKLLWKQNSEEPMAPQRMQVSNASTTFTYRGKEYQSTVVRRPDDALPVVRNEQGEKFVDNSITLHIVCGGKVVVDRTFTKESFASLVDPRFMKHAILEGMVFDQVAAQGIIYAASVCYPQSDLYVPIRLTIGVDGRVDLSREETLEDYPVDDSIR